jgi:hypothetical protein
VYVTLRPSVERKAHWNNEAGPLRLWIDAPEGWTVERRLLVAAPGDQPNTSEPRRLEFDLRAPPDAGGPAKLDAYALYYVCEDLEGTCRFLRLDVPIIVQVDQ